MPFLKKPIKVSQVNRNLKEAKKLPLKAPKQIKKQNKSGLNPEDHSNKVGDPIYILNN